MNLGGGQEGLFLTHGLRVEIVPARHHDKSGSSYVGRDVKQLVTINL